MARLSTSGTNPDGGGNFIDKECDCHVTVEKCEEEGDGVQLELKVVGSTEKLQIGKTMRDKMFFPNENSQYPQSNVNKLLGFACAVGLYNRQQWRDDAEKGVDPDIAFTEAVGCQLCVKVGLDPDKTDPNKKYARMKRSWAVGDKEAAHIPKDQELLDLFGGQLPTSEGTKVAAGKNPPPAASGGSNGSNASKPKSSPPAAAKQPVGAAASNGSSDDERW